jgi:hypothetical protein
MLLHNLSTAPTAFQATGQTSIQYLPIANQFFANHHGREPCAVQHSILNQEFGMEFGWGLDSHAAQYSPPDLTNTNMSMVYDVGDENLG